MSKIIIKLIVLIIFLNADRLYSQITHENQYLGQTQPDNIPKIFELEVAQGHFSSDRIAISNNGKEIYYSEIYNAGWTNHKIRCYKFISDAWTGPFDVFEDYMAPAFSPGGNRMFMEDYYNNTTNSYSITSAFAYRDSENWTIPISPEFLKNPVGPSYLQETNEGHYFASTTEGTVENLGNADISKLVITGTDTVFYSLGAPLNTPYVDGGFYISPDESYMILSSNRPGTSGPNDLWISYKKEDSTWTNPKNLGSPINTNIHDYGAYVSPDGKYLFFSRYSDQTGRANTYWVKIDNIIDSLRYTNFTPWLKTPIPDKTAIAGEEFKFQIPSGTFIDDDGDTLLYKVTQRSGPLPGWLKFDPQTLTLTGTPAEKGQITIRITATDPDSAQVSDSFRITIENATDIKHIMDIPMNIGLKQNYPNPFNPSTVITYQLPVSGYVKLIIYNILGQKVKTLINSFQNAGEHSIVWNGKNDLNIPVISGVYLCRLDANKQSFHKKMLLVR